MVRASAWQLSQSFVSSVITIVPWVLGFASTCISYAALSNSKKRDSRADIMSDVKKELELHDTQVQAKLDLMTKDLTHLTEKEEEHYTDIKATLTEVKTELKNITKDSVHTRSRK